MKMEKRGSLAYPRSSMHVLDVNCWHDSETNLAEYLKTFSNDFGIYCKIQKFKHLQVLPTVTWHLFSPRAEPPRLQADSKELHVRLQREGDEAGAQGVEKEKHGRNREDGNRKARSKP